MRKNIFYMALLISFSLFLFTSLNVELTGGDAGTNIQAIQHDDTEPIYSSSFNLMAPFPSNPDQMTVYKTVDPMISISDVHHFMDIFDINGEIVDLGRNMVVQEGDYELEVFKQPGTGYLRFSNHDKVASEKVAENLPTEDEAKTMAEDFVKKHNLLPENTYFYGVGYSKFHRKNAFGIIVEEGKTSISVKYGFTIDGYKAIGPGAKAGVIFGDNGEIIMVYKYWWEISTILIN